MLIIIFDDYHRREKYEQIFTVPRQGRGKIEIFYFFLIQFPLPPEPLLNGRRPPLAEASDAAAPFLIEVSSLFVFSRSPLLIESVFLFPP